MFRPSVSDNKMLFQNSSDAEHVHTVLQVQGSEQEEGQVGGKGDGESQVGVPGAVRQ